MLAAAIPSQSARTPTVLVKKLLVISGKIASRTAATATGTIVRIRCALIVQAGRPKSPSGRTARTQHEQREGQKDRVEGVIGSADDEVELRVRLHEPQREGADGCAAEATHPADDDDDEGVEQERGILPGAESDHGAAEHAAQPCERGPEEERPREHELDVDPERRDHRTVVDPGADDHAEARLLEHQHEQDPDDDRDEQHEQPEPPVRQAVDVER